MLSFLSNLFLLLIPIVLILIVRLRRRVRVVYSHTFLRAFQGEKVVDSLLRTFRIYYDVLFDLLIALVLALFFAQILRFTPRHTAICIDGSYSMIQGEEENALERAVARALEVSSAAGRARLFLLAWDREIGKTRIVRLREPRIPQGAEQAARQRIIQAYSDNLIQDHTFFNIETAELQELFNRGYRDVVFITDTFDSESGNLRVVRVGKEEAAFFFPASVHYDISSALFQVLLYRSDYERQIAVLRYDEQRGNYKAIAVPQRRISGSDLDLIEIQEEGLYRILGPGLDFIYSLRIPERVVDASGSYSRIVTDVLPQLERGDSPILMADLSYAGERGRDLTREIRALGRHRLRYITLIPQTPLEAKPLIYPLEMSFSQPAYAELPKALEGWRSTPGETTRLFFLDPERAGEGQTPLVYLSYLERDDPLRFSHEGDPDSRRWAFSRSLSGLTSLVYRRKSEVRAINLDAREFFPISEDRDLTFEKRELKPLPYFLILLALYLTKIAALLYFRRSG